jgi:H2-forming N5,N10-methylenetetrahydromethanopterin dehydrogenase-like enzyme
VVSKLKEDLTFAKKCKMEYDNSLAVEKMEAKEFELKREEDLRDLVKKVAGSYVLRPVIKACQMVVSPEAIVFFVSK